MTYAGFWIRFWASLIDTFIAFILMIPFMISVYGLNSVRVQSSSEHINYWYSSYSFSGSGGNFFLNYLFPASIVLAFWFFKSATPGKILLKLKIVDATSGEKPKPVQFFLRYIGYFLSSIFLLGFIWIAFDKRKQGWHDKIANTIVIKESSLDEVKF